MATTAIMGFFLVAVAAGINGDVMTVASGVTVEFTCTGPADFFLPTWFVNGTVAVSDGHICYRSIYKRRPGELNAFVIVIINGNNSCYTFNIYCRIFRESEFLYIHNTTLTVQGRLPSPESVHINESFSSAIEWSPPYSSLNNSIHVDPHITQYTVYITDNYTGNIIVKENVTKTRFTPNIQVHGSCSMYQVSAWNAGGEGELSEPVQKPTSVPRSIPAESITAEVTVEPAVVHIHIEDVDVACISRVPEYFIITLMIPTRRAFNETRRHQPGQAVANFTISLPQSVDVCSLHVRISAGNSAGMSAPSEAVEVVCSDGSTDSTTTTPVSTGFYSGNRSEDNEQQEDNTTLTVVLIGVIAATGGVVIVAATVRIIYCRGRKKDDLKKSEIKMKPNQAYETVTRPQPATQVHTEPCPAYGFVAHIHH